MMTGVNTCVETYETMHNFRTEVWWLSCAPTKVERAKSHAKRTTLGRVNFAPRVGALRNCQG